MDINLDTRLNLANKQYDAFKVFEGSGEEFMALAEKAHESYLNIYELYDLSVDQIKEIATKLFSLESLINNDENVPNSTRIHVLIDHGDTTIVDETVDSIIHIDAVQGYELVTQLQNEMGYPNGQEKLKSCYFKLLDNIITLKNKKGMMLDFYNQVDEQCLASSKALKNIECELGEKVSANDPLHVSIDPGDPFIPRPI